MRKLASVIIPCFNAQQWLPEAIDSCLQQTYSRIEIVVVNDGSTDNCLEIIKSYGDKIIWESGANKGGNYARNRGFALSSGEYIQYLDADDYLLPEKIERQVRFLEETGADVVYSDWRYKHHLPDGTTFLDDIKISGAQEDILESLLVNWWVAPAALLFRRGAVESCGGWDESLKAGQDRDFFISVGMNGAKVLYQPGCYAIYRQYGKVTVSTSSDVRRWENHCLLLEKAEKKLSQSGRLSIKYRQALAKCYFTMARNFKYIDYNQYLRLLEKTLLIFPQFKADGSGFYHLTQRVCGFHGAERISNFKYRTKQVFKKSIANLAKKGSESRRKENSLLE